MAHFLTTNRDEEASRSDESVIESRNANFGGAFFRVGGEHDLAFSW